METIKIKNIKGELLYSYTCENNSISKTLKQASIEHICLDEADLSKIRIENVELVDLNLVGANFKGSILKNVIMFGSNLETANLTYTNIVNSDFNNTTFYDVCFTGSIIEDSTFIECKLNCASFWEAFIKDSEFINGYLNNINFATTSFQNVNYKENMIRGTHDVVCIGNIGSRHSCTTVFNTDRGIFVSCGCFFGTLKEFKKRVLITHKDNPQYRKEYLDMIDYVQKRFKPKFSLKIF